MEKREYYVYDWDELDEETQELVIERYWDINVNYNWYDLVDLTSIADEYGISINPSGMEFDLYRNPYIAFDTYNHQGKPNWKVPIEITNMDKFLEKAKVMKPKDDEDGDCFYAFIDHKHMEGQIKNIIVTSHNDLQDRLQETLDEMLHKMLRTLINAYNYLTSKEAIIETLTINQYKFTKDGIIG